MLESIREQIKDSGIKQKFLAEQLGISTSMLSLVLSGERKLSDEKWMKLQTFLSVAKNHKELLSSNAPTS